MLEWFFEFGPMTKDGALEPKDVNEWARALGIRWKPWQTRMFIRMSREYVSEQHGASEYNRPPPWDGAVKMWQWVRHEQAERALDRDEQRLERDQRIKEKSRNGNRK